MSIQNPESENTHIDEDHIRRSSWIVVDDGCLLVDGSDLSDLSNLPKTDYSWFWSDIAVSQSMLKKLESRDMIIKSGGKWSTHPELASELKDLGLTLQDHGQVVFDSDSKIDEVETERDSSTTTSNNLFESQTDLIDKQKSLTEYTP